MSAALGRGVVVGVDDSDGSRLALDWAVRESAERDLRLHVLHVLEQPYALNPPHLTTDAEPRPDLLQARAEELVVDAVRHAREEAPGLRVDASVARGSATRSLLDAAAQASMLVVGARGRHAMEAFGLGSVGASLATHGTVPVVVVRAPRSGEHEQIVLGVDGSVASAAAVEFAFVEASARGKVLRPVFATHDGWRGEPDLGAPRPLRASELDEGDAAAVAESLAGWQEKFPDVTVERQFLHGHPVPALVEASRGASLLVVGSRGHGAFGRLLLGSVSLGVVHLAECPVAVVRG